MYSRINICTCFKFKNNISNDKIFSQVYNEKLIEDIENALKNASLVISDKNKNKTKIKKIENKINNVSSSITKKQNNKILKHHMVHDLYQLHNGSIKAKQKIILNKLGYIPAHVNAPFKTNLCLLELYVFITYTCFLIIVHNQKNC